MKELNLLLLFAFPLILFSQPSSIEWGIFNQGTNLISSLDVDNIGNIYRVVQCDRNSELHNNQGSKTIQSPPNNYATACLQKIDHTGNLVWSKSFIATSSGPSMQAQLKLDQEFIYLTGSFEGAIDFDLSPTNSLYPPTYGWDDMFIAKYSLNGELIWVKTMGSLHKEGANPPLIDREGNIITSVYLQQTTDLDPGPNQAIKNPGLHLIKFNSNGDYLWSRAIEGYKDIELFPDGHILLCDHLTTSIDVDPGPDVHTITPNGHWATDDYLLELDENGDFVSVFLCENTFDDLTIDLFGNIYTTGRGFQNFDLDLGSNFYSIDANWSFRFISKMNRFYNLTWLKEFEATPMSIAIDKYQNVVVAGKWVNTNDFDPGPNEVKHYTFTMNGHGLFVLQLDSKGNYIDVNSIENSESYPNNFFPQLIANSLDAIYFYSNITQSTTYFNLVEDYIPNLATNHSYGSFLVKIRNTNQDLTSPDRQANSGIEIFPNPSKQTITIHAIHWQEAQVKLFDITGKLLYQTFLSDNVLMLDISDYEQGPYVVHIIHDKECVSKKIIKN